MNYEDFFQKINEFQEINLPFVAFKYPNKKKIHLIVQHSNKVEQFTNLSQKGFVMNSFLNNNSFIIQADECFECSNFPFQNIENTQRIVIAQNGTSHIKLVEKALQNINNQVFKKVVLSKCLTFGVENKNLAAYFKKLICSYPTAFCYVMHHPKVGIWLAATPEKLLEASKSEISTMSLAGTQPYIEGKEIIWQHKEIDEQQIVTDSIVNNILYFTKNISFFSTKNLIAGKLVHICTDIKAKLENTESILPLIKRLHPTPAVCGFPFKAAQKFIVENEDYSREFYTGFCGLINYTNKEEHQFFVNLRCTQLIDNKALVYVGGGITSGSKPEKEWEELQNKAQTMINILT